MPAIELKPNARHVSGTSKELPSDPLMRTARKPVNSEELLSLLRTMLSDWHSATTAHRIRTHTY